MSITYQPEGSSPIHVWTDEIETSARLQLENLARLPFLHPHGVAAMPDIHTGIGSSVGTVIATHKAVVPATVGVDIGCGMNAVRLSLKAEQLPDSLYALRHSIERGVPLGPGGAHSKPLLLPPKLTGSTCMEISDTLYGGDDLKFLAKAQSQLGTLGSGNHFIEVCIDEEDRVWVVLHSGSRGIGNMIGRYYIEAAQREMEQWFVKLPDKDLAYLPEGTDIFDEYTAAVQWAQDYALENRHEMMETVLRCMQHEIKHFHVMDEAINCHHNYVELENHFGKNVYVTRKGAIRAREGELGVVPGSMGAKSYIVRGLGNPNSYMSCSHGAGRRMSRTAARKAYTIEDLQAQTHGVECRKDASVLDEIPAAYKDIDKVMENQKDLVQVLHTLRQVLCVKGS